MTLHTPPLLLDLFAGGGGAGMGCSRAGFRVVGVGWLCGGMFGLPFYRHRYFESNWFWLQPGHPRHQFTVRNGRTLGARARDIVHNGARAVGANVGHAAGVQQAREAMGIPWMSREEITQAIPPLYTEYIGQALMAEVLRRAVACSR